MMVIYYYNKPTIMHSKIVFSNLPVDSYNHSTKFKVWNNNEYPTKRF